MVDGSETPKKMSAMRTLGVPYTDADIAGASAAVEGKTELDALVAYLQNLGTALSNRR
jgi:cytochrome c oxidase cbb3-type subunit 2